MIKKEMVNLVSQMQRRWANIVIEIGQEYKKKNNVDNLTSELMQKIYAFDYCDVLFKPTLAKVDQFRSSKEEFLSYFLGQNNTCKEDSGFAIKNWKSIEFNNYKITEYNNYLLSMGNYFFKDQENEILKVEYTFGFIKINNNELRINLHHSSLPYGR
tara:strand:- start:475 stop:945 length:471 start_codon:yes stop_codon:yes gene_type:complete